MLMSLRRINRLSSLVCLLLSSVVLYAPDEKILVTGNEDMEREFERDPEAPLSSAPLLSGGEASTLSSTQAWLRRLRYKLPSASSLKPSRSTLKKIAVGTVVLGIGVGSVVGFLAGAGDLTPPETSPQPTQPEDSQRLYCTMFYSGCDDEQQTCCGKRAQWDREYYFGYPPCNISKSNTPFTWAALKCQADIMEETTGQRSCVPMCAHVPGDTPFKVLTGWESEKDVASECPYLSKIETVFYCKSKDRGWALEQLKKKGATYCEVPAEDKDACVFVLSGYPEASEIFDIGGYDFGLYGKCPDLMEGVRCKQYSNEARKLGNCSGSFAYIKYPIWARPNSQRAQKRAKQERKRKAMAIKRSS